MNRFQSGVKKIKKGLKLLKTIGISGIGQIVKKRLLYEHFIKQNEPSVQELEQQKEQSAHFSSRPLISLVVPLYKTPLPFLEDMINSVFAQTYTNWELCIANGSSDNQELCEALIEFQKQDERIKTVFLKENRGIAGNTNAAVQMAAGEFVAFLDHDDTLSPFALFEIVKAVQAFPETDVFYSDEDLLNCSGNKRYAPFFKPAFSIDYLRFFNYMCHFLVVRKSLGDQVGWIRSGFEGAQDFDFILRCVEKARLVTHIPKILYHWRAAPQSTASNPDNKPYATQSGILAVNEHSERLNLNWAATTGPGSTAYYLRSRGSRFPSLTIVIPSHNHPEYLKRCIRSILDKSTYSQYEILIVENNSDDSELFSYYDMLRKNAQIRIMEFNEQPFNYSRINNAAVETVDSELVLLLNNDTEVITGDWLERMAEHAVRQEVGAIGARLLYADNSLQHAGVFVGIGQTAGHSHKRYPDDFPAHGWRLAGVQNFSAVTGACMMLRRDVYQAMGGLDLSFLLAFNDIDFCLRLRKAGYLIVWTPLATLYHFESKTRGYEDTPEKVERFNREAALFKTRWKDFLTEGDPYYSPWLTLDDESCGWAARPRSLHPRAMPGLGR